MEMKTIPFTMLFTGSINVSTNTTQHCTGFQHRQKWESNDQRTMHMLMLCGFRKSKQTRRRGESYVFGIPLLALDEIRVRLVLDPAVLGWAGVVSGEVWEGHKKSF